MIEAFLPRRLALIGAVVTLVVSSLPAQLVLELKSFPPEARVVLETEGARRTEGAALRAEPLAGGWRRFAVPVADSTAPAVVRLEADGYHPKWLHLSPGATPVRLEERLEGMGSVLQLIGELPTGDSPKSVTFSPDGRMLIVPLLRDAGIDRYRVEPFSRLSRSGPAESDAREAGFVETLFLPRRSELWVSQMNNGAIQRFSIDGERHLGRVGAGGQWPKVMVASPDETLVYVSNWLTETVVIVEAASGREMARVPLSGQPRGMVLTDAGRHLWVGLYSTGDVEIIDTTTRRVVGRIALGPGAARHLVVDSTGRRVFLSDMLHGTVVLIDVASRRVVQRRRVGPNVNTIVLSPDGRYLFVSVRGRNNPETYLLRGPEFGRIVVLDAATLQTVEEVYGRHQPTGLDVSPDGRYLAATDFLDHNVALYRIQPAASR